MAEHPPCASWGVLATRLLKPVQLPLGELLALGRAPGLPACSAELAYLRVLRRMTLAELQDMATQKHIPHDNKTAGRLRLDLAGWVPPKSTRPPEMRPRPGVDLPPADSAQAAIASFLAVAYMHLRRRTERRKEVVKKVQLEADDFRETVRLYWGREGWDDPNDESPSAATGHCAKVMLAALDEDEYMENGDLTGYWSQEEEEVNEIPRGMAAPLPYVPPPGEPPPPACSWAIDPPCGITSSGNLFPLPAASAPAWPWTVTPEQWVAQQREQLLASLGDRVPTPIRRLEDLQADIAALEAEGRRLRAKSRQREALLWAAHGEVQPLPNSKRSVAQHPNAPSDNRTLHGLYATGQKHKPTAQTNRTTY